MFFIRHIMALSNPATHSCDLLIYCADLLGPYGDVHRLVPEHKPGILQFHFQMQSTKICYSGTNRRQFTICSDNWLFYCDVDEICWMQPIRSLKLCHVTSQGSMTPTWVGRVSEKQFNILEQKVYPRKLWPATWWIRLPYIFLYICVRFDISINMFSTWTEYYGSYGRSLYKYSSMLHFISVIV